MNFDLKKLLTVPVLLLAMLLNADDNGSFYRIPNTSGVRGVRALAGVAAVPRTTFRYTPGKTKAGVLDDLTLKDYAVSQDNSLLAIAESIENEDGTYLNRIIFFEFGGINIVNGMEYKAKEKLEKIFFFADNLYVIVKGEKIMLKEVYVTKQMRFSPKAVILDDNITSVCCDKNFFYLKDDADMILQFNADMEKISSIKTRRSKGVIMLQPGTDKLIHFTSENIELIQRTNNGLFKSSFKDLADVPEVVNAWHSPIKKSIYFIDADNKLYELIDLSYCEKIDVSACKQIIYNSYKREFYLLANKRNIIEIVRLYDFAVRRRLSHHTMRPETNKNIKFMIPHPAGIVLITQEGEFVRLREHKRRFLKYKIQM